MAIPIISGQKDSISSDTLFEYHRKNKLPFMYSRKFISDVCTDNKCRTLKIELFWNRTGRYLGFKLPKGEFLSKAEHVKFKSKDYNQIHQILSNPHSQLVNYSIDDLVTKFNNSNVDGISSATESALLKYVVNGAAYTTFTLWNLAYGSTKSEIERLTIKNLNTEIVQDMLDSQNRDDKIWIINHIPPEMEISGELRDKLLELISGNDILLSELSLNALNPKALTDDTQIKLLEIFNKTEEFQKSLIIRKLGYSPKLNEQVAKIISSELTHLSAIIIKLSLDMLGNQKIDDEIVSANIAQLLHSKNRYIANQALKYLENCESLSTELRREVEQFKKSNSKNYEE